MKLEKDNIHSFVDRIVGEIGSKGSAVIPLLHAIQHEYNYLPELALLRVCDKTEITPAAITGVSTFYSQFRHTPVGQHIIRVCTGLIRKVFLLFKKLPVWDVAQLLQLFRLMI